ncbi:MAG: NUDIX hydrolase [Halobacteriaceae archaeon]
MERTDGPSPPTTVASEVVYETPSFDVVQDRYRDADGEHRESTYVTESPAVVIYPYTPAGEVVVVEEWRQAVGRVNRGLPAGSMEGDEGPLEAAQRELREETGYEPAELEHFLSVEPMNGLADTVHHHVVAWGCTETASQDLDPDEVIEPATVPEEALRAALASGDLRDGRTAMAVAVRAFRNP